IIPSRPCVATNSESGAGEEDKEVERRSFARPTQVYRSSKAPTLTPQAIDPVVRPGPPRLRPLLSPICSCFFCRGSYLDFR
ncbi:hypothetical protein B296_00023843, partial [Ensete ventricosum]